MRARRIHPASGLGLLWLCACAQAPGAKGPVDLAFAESVDPTTYVVEYEQDIRWGEGKVERRYGAEYTLGAGGGPQGHARLETLRIAMSTPHGRQTIDTRHLAGIEFELRIPATGGRPGYDEDTPVLEMPGMLEGEVALARLMDYGFPELPDGPVEVGHRWTGHSSHPHVEAQVMATANATTNYHFAGWETVDGVDCARIEGRLTADILAPPYDVYGATVEFAGTLEGDLTWFFDPETGALVGMTAETASDGILTAAGNPTTIEQVTRVSIGLAEQPPTAADHRTEER